MTWADNLNFANYDDWRLPSAMNSDNTGPCSGYNCSESEMGYMYYTELGNLAHDSNTNDGPFINNWHAGYWTNTEESSEKAYIFNYNVGNQDPDNKVVNNWAWAVRGIGDIFTVSTSQTYLTDEITTDHRAILILNQIEDKGLKILDVGCGNGAFSKLAKKIGNFVCGIDVSEKNIDSPGKTRGS